MSMYSKSKYLIFCLITCFFSCNNNNEVSKEKVLSVPNNNNTSFYTLDKKNTKIIWNGYKTSDKVKVVGFFTEFSTNRDILDSSFTSILDLVSGLEFSINSSSSSSGDPMRDGNLREFFFKYLTNDFKIIGVLGRPGSKCPSDSIDVVFNVFDIDYQIRFGYNYNIENSLIEIKGPIKLENEFGAVRAYNAIHEKCYDLHKGADGVSVTWKEVDIHIKVPVIIFDRSL
jgi:hypothetical protein